MSKTNDLLETIYDLKLWLVFRKSKFTSTPEEKAEKDKQLADLCEIAEIVKRDAEVVRCHACVGYNTFGCGDFMGSCALTGKMMFGHEFCSRGKRKEEKQ